MQRGIRGARAAALLLIASGAAAFASAYIDERWIFIGALALIGWFEGIIIGVISAIVAVAADQLVVHFALSFNPDRDAPLLVGGIVAAIAGGAVRAAFSRPRLGASQQRMILPEDSRVSNLEDELSLARGHIAELESRLMQAPPSDAELTRRVAELESQLAAERMRSVQVAALEQALETARATSESLAARVEELEQAIDAGDVELERVKQEAAAECDRLQAEWNEKLNTIGAHLASDHEVDLGEAMVEREAAKAEVRNLNARIADLKRMLDQKTMMVPKPSVLLIHRDAEMRGLVQEVLEASGYTVTTAADGLEAFRLAMSDRPDVVVAETHMAKMDGRALVQMLKSRNETAHVKIILIGAPTPPGEEGNKFRPDDFVSDAANVEELKSTIVNVLR